MNKKEKLFEKDNGFYKQDSIIDIDELQQLISDNEAEERVIK